MTLVESAKEYFENLGFDKKCMDWAREVIHKRSKAFATDFNMDDEVAVLEKVYCHEKIIRGIIKDLGTRAKQAGVDDLDIRTKPLPSIVYKKVEFVGRNADAWHQGVSVKEYALLCYGNGLEVKCRYKKGLVPVKDTDDGDVSCDEEEDVF